MPPLHKMISNYYVTVPRPITEYASLAVRRSVGLNSLLPRKATRHGIHSHRHARSLNFTPTRLNLIRPERRLSVETACFDFTAHPPSPSTDITDNFHSSMSLLQTRVWKSFWGGHNRDASALKWGGALTIFPLSVVLLGCCWEYCGFNPNTPVRAKERAHYYSLCEPHCSC